MNQDLVTLEFKDGKSLDCEILGIFQCGEREYVALIPTAGSDEVYIYGYMEKDGGFVLGEIEDESLFDDVIQSFMDLIC